MKRLLLSILFLCFCQTAHADLASGLVGWWKMDEATSGNCTGASILDASGNANTGTCDYTIAGPTWSAGKIGIGCINFNYLDTQYIDIPNISGLYDGIASISVFAFVNVASFVVGDGNGFVCKRTSSNSNNSWCMENIANTTTFVADIGTSGGTSDMRTTSTGNLVAGTWEFIGFTFTGSTSTTQLYFNGAPDNSQVITGYTSIYAGGADINIGLLTGNSTYYMNGKIDNVMIWNRALSAAEVKQLYLYYTGRSNYY